MPKASEEAVDKLTMIAQQQELAIGNISAALGDRPTIAYTEELLRRKADANALSDYAERNHAARHSLGGADLVSPAAIGAMPSSPSNGKSYLASGSGWIEYAPVDCSGGDSGTTDHSMLLNRDTPGQHPQSAIQFLESDLQEIRQATSALAAVVDSKPDTAAIQQMVSEKADITQLPSAATQETAGLLSPSDKVKLDKLNADPAILATQNFVESTVSPYANRLTTLEHSALHDAPADGKQYARHNNAWTEITASSGSQTTSAYVGEIRLLPFRAAELPDKWYFCNGDRYPLSSPQGMALTNLPAPYRQDWGIAADSETINLPSLFADTVGYFLRPANNTTRMPGSIEYDAIRNITGSVLGQTGMTMGLISGHATTGGATTGAFVKGVATSVTPGIATTAGYQLAFDAAAAVPTADENRPLNIAMTPALYLGV